MDGAANLRLVGDVEGPEGCQQHPPAVLLVAARQQRLRVRQARPRGLQSARILQLPATQPAASSAAATRRLFMHLRTPCRPRV